MTSNLTDLEVRHDFFELAQKVGCQGVMSDFVTALNNGGVSYPLFLHTPITTQEDFNDEGKTTIKCVSYFFDLNHDVASQTALDEAETWAKYGELRQMASRYKKLLKESAYEKDLTSKRIYVGQGKFTVVADGLKLGADDTLFVKCTYTLTSFRTC